MSRVVAMQPSLKAGDEVDIYNKSGQFVGQIRLEALEQGMWSGQFSSGPAFSAVRGLFCELVDLANQQLFRHADEVDKKIAEFGLHAKMGSQDIDTCDIQLFDDRGYFKPAP